MRKVVITGMTNAQGGSADKSSRLAPAAVADSAIRTLSIQEAMARAREKAQRLQEHQVTARDSSKQMR